MWDADPEVRPPFTSIGECEGEYDVLSVLKRLIKSLKKADGLSVGRCLLTIFF